MKRILLPLISVALLVGISYAEEMDVQQEKKAIIAVIEEETDAAMNSDYEQWADTYVQDETNVRLSASSTEYAYIVGWDSLKTYFKKSFESASNESSKIKGIKTNYQIKVYGEAAWVMCDEKFVNTETGEDLGWYLVESRILEKKDGLWKIVCLSYVVTSSYEEKDQ